MTAADARRHKSSRRSAAVAGNGIRKYATLIKSLTLSRKTTTSPRHLIRSNCIGKCVTVE